MPKFSYKKSPRSLLEVKQGKRLLDAVTVHIEPQVRHPRETVDFEKLVLTSVPVQTIFWLWRFQCEAGICGMDVFILEPLGVYAQQIHAALKIVGADELARLVEEGVAIARQKAYAAEFLCLADQSWFDQVPLAREFSELEAINRPAWALMDPLTDLMVAYIHSNEAAFFE